MEKLRSGETVEHAIECGTHSGFPQCCIEWFVGEWQTALFEYTYISDGRYLKPSRDYLEGISWGYVPCPECVKIGNRVIVKECDCSAAIAQW